MKDVGRFKCSCMTFTVEYCGKPHDRCLTFQRPQSLGFCPVITCPPIDLESCSNPLKQQKVSQVRFLKIQELLDLKFICVASRLGEVKGFLDDVMRAREKRSSDNLTVFSFKNKLSENPHR